MTVCTNLQSAGRNRHQRLRQSLPGPPESFFHHRRHTFKFGGEVRLNRDTSFFGISPNGEYDFGGGTAYSPVNRLAKRQHNFRVGDPLPDTLSGLLSGSPFVYTVVVSPTYFSSGPHIGAAAINRNAFGFFAQDTWKISPRLVLDYGLRYELYTPVTDARKRLRDCFFHDPAGVAQQFVINPQPGYRFNKTAWDPAFNWIGWPGTRSMSAGAAQSRPSRLIYQDNSAHGSTPFAIYPRLTSAPSGPIPYGFQITRTSCRCAYTPGGANIFANETKAVAGNTVMDLESYRRIWLRSRPTTRSLR